MKILKQLFWERSGLLLAIIVFAGILVGLGLPETDDMVLPLAVAQTIVALIVVVREGRILSDEAKRRSR